jgi:taurine dioxygenase
MSISTETLAITTLGAALGAAAEDVDLNRPLGRAVAAELRRALLDHLVLCIRGQALAPSAYLESMRAFGRPMVQARLARHPEVPEITILYALAVPPSGGDTQFANMYAAYDDLGETMKQRIAGLRVVHKYDSSRKRTRIMTLRPGDAAELPDVAHPLVRTHPETGRKALYLNPNRMEQVVGLDRAESDALLNELTAHAIQPKYQYRHQWRRGDLVVWDNRCTMHKANGDYPAGARRLMHRIIVEGTVPV